uniref:CCHC-type domain-containing protein n=1 Tax=Gouania willdenowi TaxID=441366 RepID=A0A8C5I165_GOUWI
VSLSRLVRPTRQSGVQVGRTPQVEDRPVPHVSRCYIPTMMDPADSDQLRGAIRKQGSRLTQHDEQLAGLTAGLQDLSRRHVSMETQLTQLTEQVQMLITRFSAPEAPILPSVSPAAAAIPSSQLSNPARFSGDSGDSRPFLVQCGLHFEMQPGTFPTERSKVAYMISHLSGRAEAWATAEWNSRSRLCESVDVFADALSKIFDRRPGGQEAARALAALRQGRRSVIDYAIEFRTLSADCTWNEASLRDTFLYGLTGPVRDQLFPMDLPEDLDSLIALAVKMDNRLAVRATNAREDHAPLRPAPQQERSLTAAQHPDEPMQLGRTGISTQERHRRLTSGLCLYCGQQGHRAAVCPLKDQSHLG